MKSLSCWVITPWGHSTSGFLLREKVLIGRGNSVRLLKVTSWGMSWTSSACAASKTHRCPGCTSQGVCFLRAAPDIGSCQLAVARWGSGLILGWDSFRKDCCFQVSLNSDSTLDIHRGHALRSLSNLQTYGNAISPQNTINNPFWFLVMLLI